MSQNRQKLILNWIVKRLIFSKLRKRIWGSECRGFEPHTPPKTSFGMSFFCCSLYLRYLLSIRLSVSVNKFSIRLYKPLISLRIRLQYKKSVDVRALKPRFLSRCARTICAFAPYACSLHSLRSALRAVRAPHSTPERSPDGTGEAASA